MATYFGTTINDSPTAVFTAGAALTAAQGVALAMADGKVTLPAAGANVIGVVPISEGPDFAAGDDVTVQIKDIGVMIAGGKITAGDEIAVDATGKAVKAAAGNFIVGVALSGAVDAGTRIRVQITKSGYKA